MRVICNLCVAGGSLISAIFKMQFVSLCPFTIPKIVEEASGDSFFINMGFITKVGVDNKVRYTEGAQSLVALSIVFCCIFSSLLNLVRSGWPGCVNC